jgi:hypothetical protein
MDGQWTERHADPKAPPPVLEENLPLRGLRRWQQPTLILRLEDGDMDAFPYAEFQEAEFRGSFIRLHFLRAVVTIHGRNLGKLFEDLVQFHVWYVRERHTSEFDVAESEPYIERIEVKRPSGFNTPLGRAGTKSI